jgi:predicted nucleic acid-binding protein
MIAGKKKILIDVDVVTVALWEKRDERKAEALKFMENIRKNAYFVVTPAVMIEMISEWRDDTLKNKIIEFYTSVTDEFVDESSVIEAINSAGTDFEQVAKELLGKNIKDEDGFLVLAASAKNIDYLVTFNRKHLKNNEALINEILRRNKLNEVKIVMPGLCE